MTIYSGAFLEVIHDETASRFYQRWLHSPKKIEDFKSEMLIYIKLYESYKPSQSIWNQKNFSFNLDVAHHLWVAQHVIVPCSKYGNKKIAFIVGQDVLAHLKIIDAFESINSCFRPRHFASKELALEWLNNNPKTSPEKNVSTEIIYDGVDDNGKAVLRVISPQIDLQKTLKKLSPNEEEIADKEANYEKITSLSKREFEVLQKFTQGLKTKEIADNLCISNHTVQTHWKSIKRKLQLSHTVDIFKYLRFIK